MKTLSKVECTEWLLTRGIAEDPYHLPEPPTVFVDQVGLPAQPWRKRTVVDELLRACGPYEAALLQFTDWFPHGDAMTIVEGVRAQHGDQRSLIESPGHLLVPGEQGLLLGIFSLAMFYGFTAYLYFSHGTTILEWEGEMLDLWTSDEQRFTEAQVAFERLKLERPSADA